MKEVMDSKVQEAMLRLEKERLAALPTLTVCACADYVQQLPKKMVTHKNCDYIIFDIKDIGYGEVLAQCKVKNEQGEFVGLIPFTFIYSLEGAYQDDKERLDCINKQAEVELNKILNK